MEKRNNISASLIKALTVILLVLFLGACGDKGDNGVVIGDDVDVEDASCLSCEILNLMYDAVGQNVMLLHTQFSAAAMPIMMVGFSIWLALRLLKFVSSVSETNAGEVWNEILKKAFICMICGILASSSLMLRFTINTIVIPVYLAFLDLGMEILKNSLSADGSSTSFEVFGTSITLQTDKLFCKLSGGAALTETGFPPSIKNSMDCMIRALSANLTIGGQIAKTSMRQTDTLMGVIMGFFLHLFFWVVKIGFSFYLVDAIFQMGIIILLLPLFILSYAFEPTRKWTGIGFGHILSSAGFMMCFSIIVALVLSAMVALITNNQEIFNPADLESHMKDLSIGFMCLLLIGFLIYGSMGVSQQLTSGLLGTNMDSKFQKNLKAVVQGAIEGIWSGLGALISWGSSLAPQSNIKLVRGVAIAIKKAGAYRAKLQRLAGRK